MATISALTAAIDAKDHYTYDHSKNVARYAANLAVGAGLNEEQVRTIYAAGLLHDIGKISIPEDILNKSGKLSPEEYQVMKSHVNSSIEMIRHLPEMEKRQLAPDHFLKFTMRFGHAQFFIIADAVERRIEERRAGRIVVSDDADIVRNPDTSLAERLIHFKRRLSADDEQPGEIKPVPVQISAETLVGAVFTPAPAFDVGFDHGDGDAGEPGEIGESLTAHVEAVAMRLGHQHGQFAVPVIDQVRRRNRSSRRGVAGDHG
ncbi:hypothetical protein SDC9_127497 [bioreactor metagenome]|uniref:HD-GYP domain-containing protein n=1 Tax=bioreactor metagenome TaxID=1076179 RepID=A0A645CTL3_9ZZZZ